MHASASVGYGADSAGKPQGTGKDKNPSGWLNKAVILASAVLRNDHVASKSIATQMSTHDVAGPLIKRHMDSHHKYWVIG